LQGKKPVLYVEKIKITLKKKRHSMKKKFKYIGSSIFITLKKEDL